MIRFSGTDGKTDPVSLGKLNFLLNPSLLTPYLLRLKIILLVNFFVVNLLGYPVAWLPVKLSCLRGTSRVMKISFAER